MIGDLHRLPAPAPAPQGLAHDGEALWMSSWETQHVYGFHPQSLAVFEETESPGRRIVGMLALTGELRIISGEEDDNRYIRRYVPGSGFVADERIACPDFTGSFLAHDGTHLWLSQRFNKRVLRLDERYHIADELHVGAQIIGIVWLADALYFSSWHGKAGGCKIGRIDRTTRELAYVAALPFAGISLTHDGSHFWTNDHRGNAVVSFTLV